MRIAILSTIQNYEWAGTEEVWAQFARVALAQGHVVHASVHWRVSQSHHIETLKHLGLKVSVRQPFRPVRAYLLKERIYGDMRAIETFQPDVILINSGSLFDILNLPALRQFCDRVTIPKIFFCHFVADGFIPHNRDQVRDFAKSMDGWVFVSKHNKYLAERQLAYVFKNNEVIVNGPRLFFDKPLTWPQDNTIQFGCVARLETLWKGQDVLLKVLSQPQWRDRSWHLNLYGSGPDEIYIQQLIQYYDLDKHVTCYGYVQDIEAVWEKNHLMVLASRGEGMPLAVLEAMMCGRPTITTDVGGNREILSHGKTGFIAHVATPYAFSQILEEAWEKRDRWSVIGYSAHQDAKQFANAEPSKQLLHYLKSFEKK